MKKTVVEESVLVEPELDFDIDTMKVPVVVVANTPKLEKEYRRISNKLGTAFAETLHTADLAKYLAENSIDVYPIDKVKAYLEKKMADLPKTRSYDGWGERRTTRWTWNWMALREQDILKSSGNFSKLYSNTNKPVPVEVLMTVEKIVDDLGPTHVHFYVSEFVKAARPTPRVVDPFLAVCSSTAKLFVIERWDEPSFRS
jgi:hypothetical protein